MFNGQEGSAIRILSNSQTQLTNRIEKLYSDTFKPRLATILAQSGNGVTFDAEVTKFVERAKKIPAGPTSVRKFRIWLAERIASELLSSDAPDEGQQTLRAAQGLKFYHELKKQRGMTGTPGRNFPAGHFYPTCALQTHSENARDENVQIWAVEFEPDVVRNGATTSLLASCGGDTICFVNVKTGKVRSKFVEPGEEFFCCSWSAQPISGKGLVTQQDTILAVGGKSSLVYVISPHDKTCTHKIRPSKVLLLNIFS